jgi:dipeptidyl-peptidase-4
VTWDREAFPYVASVSWGKHGPLTISVLDRLQKALELLAVDPKTGATRVLAEERSTAWVDVDSSVPRWTADGSEFVWAHEREGAPRLELRRANGEVVRPLGAAGPSYRELLDLDESAGAAIVAGAKEPTEAAVLRVPLDGSPPTALLHVPDGVAYARFGVGHGVYVASEASATELPRSYVHTTDGRRVEIPQVTETPSLRPAPEFVRVGADEVRVAIVRPTRFEPGRRYPIVDAAYGGPGVHIVEKSAKGFLRAQWMADAVDAIVVSIDAKGTPFRGADWEHAIQGKFGSVPLRGHVDTIRELAATRPEMDLTRVGIFGWSFGGYLAALAVLREPDFYRVGVAGAPPCDWRDYDTAYTERYLGLPDTNEAAYADASLLTHAAGSSAHRPLLVVHGTADDNVYFTNSLKLADALARAGRPYELLPALGMTHLIADPAESELVWRHTAEFLRAHL